MKAKLSILVLALLGWSLTVNAQVITADPVFPLASDAAIITFNADFGDMGLKNYAGDDVYAHTGVITDKSTGSSDWKYVIATWSTNLPKAKLTKVSANVYTLSISPSIREFYGVPAGEKILKLAFVFRNSDGSRTGRDVGGADIFYNVSETPVFTVMLTQPDKYSSLVNAGETVNMQASASMGDSVVLFQNGIRLKKEAGLTVTHSLSASGSGLFKIVARAYNGLTETKEDSAFYYILPPQEVEDVPAGMRPGVNVIGDNSVLFVLYAPGKNNVFILGDFNGWVFRDEGYMKKSSDGKYFWKEVTGLNPAIEYSFQYGIDGTIRIPDPYTTKVLDPWNDKFITSATYPNLKPYPEGFAENLVSVFRTRPPQYTWKTSTFTAPAKDNMIIYELLVRDFVAAHDFKTIRDTLSYLKRLGVNAVEFMPVTEFDGNSSWGYNPAMYFAIDKYYGPSDTFKELIDSCHSKGIAVIMDMVLNHSYGNNPLVRLYFNSISNKPAINNPWFNEKAPHSAFGWGYDFNHESYETQKFVDSICHYWISEFRIDGFRFDFTKGFTNKATANDFDMSAHDASRVAILKRMGDKIWSYKPEAILILEHWTENAEEKELASYGFLSWGDGKYGYRNASVGESSNISFSEASWKNLGWDVPGLVDYMESHDEERVMFLNLNQGKSYGAYDIKDFNTALKRVKLAATFFFTIPGTKMLWQFQELGYDYSIDYNSRLGEKPIRWDFYNDAGRRNLFDNFSALAELKKSNAVFRSSDFWLYEAGMTKRLNISGSDMDVVVLGNFNLMPQTINPNFTKTGTWYEFFSGKTVDVTAANQNTPISLMQGEYRLYTSKQVTRPSFLTGIENQDVNDGNGLLFEVFPNPFTYEAIISFGGEDEYQPHIVEIFDSNGRIIRNIALPAGISEVKWDGRTSGGSAVARGIYFIKVSTGRKQTVQRIIRL